MALRYYQRIFDECEPYVVARSAVAPAVHRAPLGIPIGDDNIIDPQRVDNGPFLGLLKTLDELTYGPRALGMPSWVFYDCAVMPGALFGFARRAASVQPWVRRALGVPDGYLGLVPVSLFIAIPMAHRLARLVYTLCSINQVAPGAAPEGLWRLTLAAGADALGIHVMVATAQWRSAQLGVYAALGPLRLITAWTPAHDIEETATFYVHCDSAAYGRLLRGDVIAPGAAERYLDADDGEAMQRLQGEIEAGHEVWVVGPPEIRGSETRIPLAVQAPPVAPVRADDSRFLRRFQG